MRVLLYIVILGLLFLAPVQRLDVAELEPVQTVAMDYRRNAVVLETDTGNRGIGKDVESAMKDLREKTPGVIYLDTAEYLLITESAAAFVEDLQDHLSTAVRVSLWDGEGSVKGADKYLSAREDLPKIEDWKNSLKNNEKSS